MRHIQKRIGVGVILLVLISGCSNSDHMETLRLGAPEPRAALLEGLESRGVSFTQLADGTVRYSYRDKEVVELIAHEVMSEFYPPHSISFPRDTYAEEFSTLLASEGVKSRHVRLGGRIYVAWDDADTIRVDPLLSRFRGHVQQDMISKFEGRDSPQQEMR